MTCQCSICRGVPRVNPESYVTPPVRPTISELLHLVGYDDVRAALVDMLRLMTSGAPR